MQGYSTSKSFLNVSPGNCNVDKGGCEHGCRQQNRFVRCFCNSGFVLNRDRKTCADINECQFSNAGCRCAPTPQARSRAPATPASPSYRTAVAGLVAAVAGAAGFPVDKAGYFLVDNLVVFLVDNLVVFQVDNLLDFLVVFLVDFLAAHKLEAAQSTTVAVLRHFRPGNGLEENTHIGTATSATWTVELMCYDECQYLLEFA
ncbi:hypothetical protein HAZT_HAZT008093 [Hyalella azteca]|uniref:Complement Clr-like EGF domain-containing protein n=1 Tax=Hyalella azteca TaxID=294128 RepID=A0A6A0H7T7_HYAAZ|nr:hypothetical protein HAZT_HAZT008093 [Hyalella azteca]